MSDRRAARRAAAPVIVAREVGVPVELLVGPCLEVWTPADHHLIRCHMRYVQAVHVWLERNGYDVFDRRDWPLILRGSCKPWSYADTRRDHPDFLTQRLRRVGLPKSWRPKPANLAAYGVTRT